MPERMPARPANIDPLAAEILEGLRGSPEAGDIVLGRYFALKHYVDSVELDSPLASTWEPILIESLADNVGAKMNAVVERGAARDFLDVRELVTRGIVTVEECWDWWSGKNPGKNVGLARANSLRHLEALERRRPLDEIRDTEERASAHAARRWIRETLLQLDGTNDG